jgi:GNAT superfamily N-acetyltransferase
MVSPEGLVVKSLTEYDPGVAARLGQLVSEVNPNDEGAAVSEDLLRDIINSPDRDQLIAELHGQIVGKAVVNLLVHDRKRKAYLDYFASAPSVRGQGVGYAIWRAACAWSIERGAVQLNWTTDNPEAIPFYLRQGAIIRPTTFFDRRFSPEELRSGGIVEA